MRSGLGVSPGNGPNRIVSCRRRGMARSIVLAFAWPSWARAHLRRPPPCRGMAARVRWRRHRPRPPSTISRDTAARRLRKPGAKGSRSELLQAREAMQVDALEAYRKTDAPHICSHSCCRPAMARRWRGCGSLWRRFARGVAGGFSTLLRTSASSPSRRVCSEKATGLPVSLHHQMSILTFRGGRPCLGRSQERSPGAKTISPMTFSTPGRPRSWPRRSISSSAPCSRLGLSSACGFRLSTGPFSSSTNPKSLTLRSGRPLCGH